MIQRKHFQVITRFIISLTGINYCASILQNNYQQLLNHDYINPQTGKRQVFDSFIAVILFQKTFTLISTFIALLIIKKCYPYLNMRNQIKFSQFSIKQQKCRQQQQRIKQSNDQNQKYSMNNSSRFPQTQTDYVKQNQYLILCGFLSFLSIYVFSQIQQNVQVLTMTISKYVNMFIIIILIYILIPNCYQSYSKCSFYKYFFLTIIFITVSLAFKLVNQLFGYYSYNLTVHFMNQSPKYIVMLVISLVLDNAYHILLYFIRDKFNRSSPKSQLLASIQMLYQITKWSLIFFASYTLLVGQMSYLYSSILKYPFIVNILLKSSFISLVNQILIFILIISFQPHIFLAVIASKGIFSYGFMFLINQVKYHSIIVAPFFLLCIIIGIMVVGSVKIKYSNDLFKRQHNRLDEQENMFDSSKQDENQLKVIEETKH